MSPQKSKSKKKPKTEAVDKDKLSEVDKTFYELQIADLNRKLVRLRTLSTDLEQRNAELSSNIAKLDEDRADIIAFLKRNLLEKTDELSDLVDRLQSLRVKRQEETEDFQKQLQAKDDDFKKMQDHLTSEIKLLEGKLELLEEFRVQKEELTRKFEVQERDIKEQEERHQEQMYSVEKKFIVDKDTLKKLMEHKVIELSEQFQNLTDKRIASSTKRLIMENIALGYELHRLVEERKLIFEENEGLNVKFKQMKLETKIQTESVRKVIANNKKKKAFISELVKDKEVLNDKLNKMINLERDFTKQNGEISMLNAKISSLQATVSELQENLLLKGQKTRELLQELSKNEAKTMFLSKALFQRIESVRNASGKQKVTHFLLENNEESTIRSDEIQMFKEKELILQDVYNLFLQTREFERNKGKGNWSELYNLGSIGFVPRQLSETEEVERNAQTQVGISFEEFLRATSPPFEEDSNENGLKSEELLQKT